MFQLFGYGSGLQTIKRRASVIDDDLKLWNADLLFDLKIDHAGDFIQRHPELLGNSAHRVEVLAKDLERNLRPHP